MSILRVAVETHVRRNNLDLRDLLAAAYYKKYQKAIPDGALTEDVKRWNAGEHNIPYLYDFMLQTCAV